jgi:hypothetical protein
MKSVRELLSKFKLAEASQYQMMILGGLQNRQQYQGTADRRKVAKRRAANKVAHRQRMRNQHASSN